MDQMRCRASLQDGQGSQTTPTCWIQRAGLVLCGCHMQHLPWTSCVLLAASALIPTPHVACANPGPVLSMQHMGSVQGTLYMYSMQGWSGTCASLRHPCWTSPMCPNGCAELVDRLNLNQPRASIQSQYDAAVACSVHLRLALGPCPPHSSLTPILQALPDGLSTQHKGLRPAGNGCGRQHSRPDAIAPQAKYLWHPCFKVTFHY